MIQTTFTFYWWNSVLNYNKYDVINGANSSEKKYYTATTANSNCDPTASFSATASSYSRTSDVAQVNFTQGGNPLFQPGSIVYLAGLSNGTLNYSGICLDAGSGYVKYLNPGWDAGTTALGAGSVTAPIHPAWTTGFFWIPSYSTEVSHNQNVSEVRLGDGYSQRSPTAINSNSLLWNMQFNERSDLEAKSLLNFIQSKGGVNPFPVNFPVSKLYNKANLKYIAKNAKHGLSSFGLNNVTIEVQQVFDL